MLLLLTLSTFPRERARCDQSVHSPAPHSTHSTHDTHTAAQAYELSTGGRELGEAPAVSERREALMREVYGTTFQDGWSWYGACRVVQQVEDAAEGPPIRDGATESMQEYGRLQANRHPESRRMRQGSGIMGQLDGWIR